MDKQYFGSHLGIVGSRTWGPKFIDFFFGTQGVFVPNFKSVSQIVSKIWAMKYIGGHLGIEGSITWGSKFIKFAFWTQGTFVPNFKSVAQRVSEIWTSSILAAILEL